MGEPPARPFAACGAQRTWTPRNSAVRCIPLAPGPSPWHPACPPSPSLPASTEHRLGVGGKGREGNAFPGFRRPLWLWGEAGTDWKMLGTLLPALPRPRGAVAGLDHKGHPRPLAGLARVAQPVGTVWWGHGWGTPLPPPAPHPVWDVGAVVSIRAPWIHLHPLPTQKALIPTWSHPTVPESCGG